MKKRIIITGGLGQDGIILNKLLLRKQFTVYSFINKKKFKKIPKIKYIDINLLDSQKVNESIKYIKPYAIIHLAAKNNSNIKTKNMKHKIFYKRNFLITTNLIDSVVKNNKKIKFIFAGSSQMFMKQTGVVNENSRLTPSCYYSKYKIDAHNYIIKKKNKFDLYATTAILFNHDSRYRNPKFLFSRLANYFKHKNLTLIKKVYNNNIFGDFSHAEDICNGIFLLLSSKINPDKIIFSSNVLFSINKLIEYGLIKSKIKNRFPTLQKKMIKLIGNNNYAIKSLNWNLKKNSLIAFKEIIKDNNW